MCNKCVNQNNISQYSSFYLFRVFNQIHAALMSIRDFLQTKCFFKWSNPNFCVYIYIHTLTGHFIRYTLLVQGWTPFCLQNCLNSLWLGFNECWKHSSEILVCIDMIASRCCCGGHLSKVNSLSYSRNQSEMIFALWHGALSCWK